MAKRNTKNTQSSEPLSVVDSIGCGIFAVIIVTMLGFILNPWILLLIPVAILVAIGSVSNAFKHSAVRKSKLKSFDEYVVRLVRHELRLTEQKEWRENLDWNGWNTDAEFALRCVEILAQSSYHALNSKKQDTAKSNFDIVQMEWRAFNGQRTRDDMRPINCRQYFHDEVVKEITNCYERTMSAYHEAVLNNHINGVLEKAAKLKTAKARQKYYELAMSAIVEAKKEGNVSLNIITRLESDVNEMQKTG